MALRGGHTTRDRVDVVPTLATAERAATLVERTGAGAAFEAVRRVELLLEHWGAHPPGELRAGGLGVRELKAVAAHLHVDEPTAALLVEAAAEARLLAARYDDDGNAVFAPTDEFDAWTRRPAPERWTRARLRLAVLDPAARPGRDPRPRRQGPRRAVGGELQRLRRRDPPVVLEEVGALPPGQVLATGTGPASLVERLAWLRPRRPRTRADHVAWALREATTLGLRRPRRPAAVRPGAARRPRTSRPCSRPLLPAPVDHVLLQADLTAVAPGPLEPDLARRLQVVAEVESRGGATVYRFTSASVRRALDVGWTAAEVHAFVADVSRTPVPQPLTLSRRRHGPDLRDDPGRSRGGVPARR